MNITTEIVGWGAAYMIAVTWGIMVGNLLYKWWKEKYDDNAH